MKKATLLTNQTYDLSNPHFRQMEIITNKNEKLKGQFVRFSVRLGEYDCLYPAEKLCFLPEKHRKEFDDAVKINGGQFEKFPPYVKQFGLNEIKQILIVPVLVI